MYMSLMHTMLCRAVQMTTHLQRPRRAGLQPSTCASQWALQQVSNSQCRCSAEQRASCCIKMCITSSAYNCACIAHGEHQSSQSLSRQRMRDIVGICLAQPGSAYQVGASASLAPLAFRHNAPVVPPFLTLCVWPPLLQATSTGVWWVLHWAGGQPSCWRAC